MIEKKTKKCLICGSRSVFKYLDLGQSALANAFLEKKDLNKKEHKFALQVLYCKNCHLAQLGVVVDRKLIFENYAYFSGDSPQLQKYFKDYAENIYKKFPEQIKRLTVEIASNDGILLKYFKDFGAKVLGVDPAKNIARLANKKGIETLAKFFNLKTAEDILKKWGQAGVIAANNVLAHSDIPHEIIAGVKKLLAPSGVFVFEVQYAGDLIKKNEFDNTYHEHIFYFSLAPLLKLLEKHELQIFNLEQTNAQGGSIRVYAGHTPLLFPVNAKVKKLLIQEKKQGLYDFKTYRNFGKKPEKIKRDLVQLLKKLKKQGKTIAGYGASAKGNTLLQFSKIGPNLIDYIVDTAASKQGKYTPGTHIPIFSPEHLKKKTPDYLLILAWNYADSIMAKEAWFRERGGKFIKPIPYVKII